MVPCCFISCCCCAGLYVHGSCPVGGGAVGGLFLPLLWLVLLLFFVCLWFLVWPFFGLFCFVFFFLPRMHCQSQWVGRPHSFFFRLRIGRVRYLLWAQSVAE